MGGKSWEKKLADRRRSAKFVAESFKFEREGKGEDVRSSIDEMGF